MILEPSDTPAAPGRIVALASLLVAIAWCLILLGCGGPEKPPAAKGFPKPYRVNGQWYQPVPHAKGFTELGVASWYGKKFHGRRTSNGETYDMHAMTAAHKTLPFGTLLRVENLDNNRSTDLRVNDRGPFVRDRIIDLSYAAAKKLGVVGPGTARVRLTALGIVTPEGHRLAPGDPGAPVDYYSGNFTIQIGAFKERANAENLRNKLDQTYKNAHIVVYRLGPETFYRVRVGACSSLTQAVEYEQIMIRHGFENAFIVAE